MTGVLVLRPTDAARMAFLHGACFPEQGQWDQAGFSDLMALPTTLALGLDGTFGLDSLILVQIMDPEAEVLTLCVAPTARRSGSASQLFTAALQLLGARGIARIMLDVAADNHAALAFYAHHNFAIDGRRKGYYHRANNQPVDAVLMSRPIAGQI